MIFLGSNHSLLKQLFSSFVVIAVLSFGITVFVGIHEMNYFYQKLSDKSNTIADSTLKNAFHKSFDHADKGIYNFTYFLNDLIW